PPPVKGGPVNEPRVEEEDQSAGSYTIEAEALRCDICFKPFGEQIFMCKNGHPACGSCCLIMDRMCFCTEPIGDIRCRALEKVLAAMTDLRLPPDRHLHREAAPRGGVPVRAVPLPLRRLHLLRPAAVQPHRGPPRVRRRRGSGGRALQPALGRHAGEGHALPRAPAPRRRQHVPPAQRRRRPGRPLAVARLHGPSPHRERRGEVQDGGEEAERPGGARAVELRGRALRPAAQGFPGQRVPLRAQLLLGLLRQRLGHGAPHRRL
uniref:Uncharacterized protein n=1 Tax=Aegilops tauschii subsp. strangulata TaxID=200361 RepID=A0A453QN06_AEGTS